MLHCWGFVVEVGVGSLVASSRASWWLRLSRVLVLQTKWTDGETVAKVCQALPQSSEWISEARALSCPYLCGRIVAVPKLCGCIGRVAMAVPRQKLFGRIETVTMAVPTQSCADVSKTVAMALLRQSSAQSSKQARTPRQRLAQRCSNPQKETSNGP